MRNATPKPRRWGLNLRRKLLLVSLTLLVVPWIGYQYVQEMEAYLRRGQEQALLATARAAAAALHAQPKLFKGRHGFATSIGHRGHWFVQALDTAILLDGYAEDWQDVENRAQDYLAKPATDTDDHRFRLTIGHAGRHLYALIQVHDRNIVYQGAASDRLQRSDHLIIAVQDQRGAFVRYGLATAAPGRILAQRLSSAAPDAVPIGPEPRIQAYWQPRHHGYTVEVRIPLDLLGGRFGIAVFDVDDAQQPGVRAVAQTADTTQLDDLGTLAIPDTEVQRLLQELAQDNLRIWVVDSHQRVLGLAGRLQPSTPIEAAPGSLPGRIMHAMYRLILRQPGSGAHEDRTGASYLDHPEVQTALGGTPAAGWQPNRTHGTALLTASHPIGPEDDILGAVAIEQPSDGILILQNRALENLINLSLAVFMLVTLGLLLFASRLSARVRQLRDAAENAIGADGKVVDAIKYSRAADEIGDLNRSVAGMLERLRQYTAYLETMAGKLSHELRTPLTVVQSSLENLDPARLDPDSRIYTERAQEGVARLRGILTRMSEATRLEQSLQTAEREAFSLHAVVNACVAAYRTAYPDAQFLLNETGPEAHVLGIPDLIAQLLDKLVANANDFHHPGTPIAIDLLTTSTAVELCVSNQGPALPEDMQTSLFDSMVSMRERGGDAAHLGLGLYIVRLISEFHAGSAQARNLADGSGVVFSVRLPRLI